MRVSKLNVWVNYLFKYVSSMLLFYSKNSFLVKNHLSFKSKLNTKTKTTVSKEPSMMNQAESSLVT